MRIPALAMLTLFAASCASGPSVGPVEDFQEISAGQIGGGIASESIKISARRALLFTTYWTAVTPDGAVYECSRDLSSDQCVPQHR